MTLIVDWAQSLESLLCLRLQVVVQTNLVQIRAVTTHAASPPLHDEVPNFFPQRARVGRRFILIFLLQSTREDGRIMSTFQKMEDTVGVIRYTPPISAPVSRQLLPLRVSKHVSPTLTLGVTGQKYMILL